MQRARSPSVGLLVVLAVLGSVRCGGDPTPPKVATLVLVTIDTLRRDHVSAYVGPGGAVAAATPALDALAARGLRFADARTPAPLTLPAHTAMLTGLPPAVHGLRTNGAAPLPARAGRRFATLPERLGDAGWCTGAFVSAAPLAARYGLAAGFHAYDDGGLDRPGLLTYAERPGPATVARALAWLGTVPRDRPVFLWVHLFEPHAPHRQDYRTDVEEADAAFEALTRGVEDARGAGVAMLVTADHGEALGELGEPTHAYLLGEAVLRVPLLLAGPGIRPGVRADPADVADVAPTLARLAGIPFPVPDDLPGTGRDLLAGPAPADRARVAEALHAWQQHRWAQLSAAVVAGWKLEDRGDGPGRRLLFRLDDRGAGPGVPLDGRDEALAPAAALRAYRHAESAPPGAPGAPAGGYGGGGPPGRFLDPAENGRRPDPYAMIADTGRLETVATAVLATPPVESRLREALRHAERLAERDPGNPAAWFWVGRARRVLALHATALEAFSRALELGREDADTILLAGRSALAMPDPARTLRLLETFGPRVPPDPRLDELEAEAATAAGDPDRARRAAAAAATRRSPPSAAAPVGCR